MGYNIFWAKHIDKPDTLETGVKIIVGDELARHLKNGAVSASARVVSAALDLALVKNKGMPLPDGVETSIERCKDPDGYEVTVVVKAIGNKGWRNWFLMPVWMRREQFRAIDEMVGKVQQSLQEAIEPLCRLEKSGQEVR